MPDMDWTPVHDEFMRLVEENYTNEEWFCQLPTEEKAKRIINIAINSDCDYETIVEWLKQPHTKGVAEMKSCKNCEWAGYCTFDDNAVMCERDGSEYIPADKVKETAEKCTDYRGLKQPHKPIS